MNTPMQMLVRLAELTREITSSMPHDADYDPMCRERDALLAMVPSVPAELEGCMDASLWAIVLGSRYDHKLPVGVPEMWFVAALRSAHVRGVQEGQVVGVVSEREQRSAAQGMLIDRMHLFKRLLESKRITDIQLRGDTEGAPPIRLSALVDEALAAVDGVL